MKFRLVDRIVGWSPLNRIQGVKAVSFEEYSLKDAWGDEAHLPETLVLESLLQLGNWLILLSSDFRKLGLVVRIQQAQFHRRVRPGERLDLEVVLTRQRADGFELAGEGRVEGQCVVSGFGCLAAPVAAVEYTNPEDLRVLAAELMAT
jgi:3-hydroxyacyl-[acyl-carrier-protein] dehydratase